MITMEPRAIAKQIMAFQKATVDSSFDALGLLQDQTERLMSMLTQQAFCFPDEGKKVLGEWVTACKKTRDDFKQAVDENFKNMESFLGVGEKGEAA